MWSEDRCEFLEASQGPCLGRKEQTVTYMLVHILGNVGYVKVGVAVIGELLELGIERFLIWSAKVE